MFQKTSFVSQILLLAAAALALTACGQSPIQANYPLALKLPSQPVRMVQPAAGAVTLLLKFKPTTSRNERSLFLSQYNLSVKEILTGLDLYLVAVPAQAPLAFLQTLKADARLSYVESNSVSAAQTGFLTQPATRFQSLVGKQVELEGIYSGAQSGASLLLAEGDELPLVSQQGQTLNALPSLEDRTRVRLIGIVRPALGASPSVALMPVKYQRI